jgi:hypothetical protein
MDAATSPAMATHSHSARAGAAAARTVANDSAMPKHVDERMLDTLLVTVDDRASGRLPSRPFSTT